MSTIEMHKADGTVETCSAEFRLDHFAIPGGPGGIAIDSRVPVLQSWATTEDNWTNITPSADEIAEAEFVRSLYEGVSHGEGQRREREYRQKVEEQRMLARVAKRR